MSEEVLLYIISRIKRSKKNSKERKTCYAYVKQIKERLDKIDSRI